MPINLTRLPAAEAERLAYAEGFPMAAQLFLRIADLEAQSVALVDALDATPWEHMSKLPQVVRDELERLRALVEHIQ